MTQLMQEIETWAMEQDLPVQHQRDLSELSGDLIALLKMRQEPNFLGDFHEPLNDLVQEYVNLHRKVMKTLETHSTSTTSGATAYIMGYCG